jgi:hypothetical protein
MLELIVPASLLLLCGITSITDPECDGIPVLTSVDLSFKFPTMCFPLPKSVILHNESISLQQWVDMWLQYHAEKSAITKGVKSA